MFLFRAIIVFASCIARGRALPVLDADELSETSFLQSRLEMLRSASVVARDDVCEERRQWLAGAPRTQSEGQRTPFGLVDASCARVDNVCIHQDGSLVIMAKPNITDGVDSTLDKYKHGDAEFDALLNMPGYNDATPGTQYKWPATYVRASGSLDPPELQSGWSQHSSHVPALYVPVWFDNIGENMAGEALDLALHLHDAQIRDQSLIIGTPQGMVLPSWWKLMGGLVHSVRGLYETGLHCNDQPAPCFDYVFACGHLFPPTEDRFERIRNAGIRKVGTTLTSIVNTACTSSGAPLGGTSRRDRIFRVWFDERLSSRRILNLDEMEQNCSQWIPDGYDSVVCKRKPITSSLDAACELSGYDVLVAIHGAGIANGLFVKQAYGAIVEVSAEGWAPPSGPEWGGTLYYNLFKNTPVRYFSYAVPEQDTRPGEIEACYNEGRCKDAGIPLRDKDVQVRWSNSNRSHGQGGLREILEQVAAGAPDGHGRSAQDLIAAMGAE